MPSYVRAGIRKCARIRALSIILDVMAKNDRKAFIIDANQFAMMRRQK